MLSPSLHRLPLFALLLLLLTVPLLADTPAAPPPDLYVSSAPVGAVLRLNGATGATAGVFQAGNEPSGVALGPDGALYAASFGSGTVVRIDPVTGQTKSFAVPGPNGLYNPLGLTFGPDGNLYAVANGGVLRFNGKTGDFIDTFVPYASGGLSTPYDLRFGPDGNLYVTSGGSGSVLRYDGTTGAFIDAFVPSGSGGLTGPTTLTFGPDGDLYVAGQSGVLRYNGKTGAFVGVAVGPVIGLFGLAFGQDGTLYVTSTANPSGLSNYSILHFDPTTKKLLGVFASLNSELDFLAFAPPTPVSLATQELIVNGGFETNGLSGWTVTNETGSNGSYYAASGTSLSGLPYNGPDTVGPASGTGYAVSDEGGPTASALTQTFTVPADATQVTLSYDMFVNDYSAYGPVFGTQGLDFSFEQGPNQQARVDLLTATASPLSTAPADVLQNFYDSVDSNATPKPHGYTHYSFDITSLVGKGGAYTLRFAQVDNQAPLIQGIDNVSVKYTGGSVGPPLAPLTLAISPKAVIGGSNATATITLDSPAIPGPDPSGEGLGQYGAVIRLDADTSLHIDAADYNSAYLFHGNDGNTYLLIFNGQTTANLRLSTTAVTAPTTALLKATYGGGTTTTALTINPLLVSSLTVSPASIHNGDQATATVTLNAPAIPSPDPTVPGQTAPGVVLRLDSSNPAAVFVTGGLNNNGYLFQALDGHFYVFIPQGQTTVSFGVRTLPVSTKTAATLTATLNSASQSATLTIQPGTHTLILTAKFSRDAKTGQIVAAVTVANTGTAVAASARLTAATLGTGKALTLPTLGTIAPGGIATAELRFPATAGKAGAASVLRLSGVYATGSFQSSQRVTLP